MLIGERVINVDDWLNHIIWPELTDETQLQRQQFRCILKKWEEEGKQHYLKALLQFTTSLKQLPTSGFSGLNPPFTIVHLPISNGIDKLPTSRTCFNTLQLSSYSNVEMMEMRVNIYS
jgi:hypothetical protein